MRRDVVDGERYGKDGNKERSDNVGKNRESWRECERGSERFTV